jgi:hypothetical protein
MGSDQLLARDAAIRQAAFDHVRALQRQPLAARESTARHLEAAQMPFLLSIRTVFPRQGARVLNAKSNGPPLSRRRAAAVYSPPDPPASVAVGGSPCPCTQGRWLSR